MGSLNHAVLSGQGKDALAANSGYCTQTCDRDKQGWCVCDAAGETGALSLSLSLSLEQIHWCRERSLATAQVKSELASLAPRYALSLRSKSLHLSMLGLFKVSDSVR